jgi:hypothetical protein
MPDKKTGAVLGKRINYDRRNIDQKGKDTGSS